MVERRGRANSRREAGGRGQLGPHLWSPRGDPRGPRLINKSAVLLLVNVDAVLDGAYLVRPSPHRCAQRGDHLRRRAALEGDAVGGGEQRAAASAQALLSTGTAATERRASDATRVGSQLLERRPACPLLRNKCGSTQRREEEKITRV